TTNIPTNSTAYLAQFNASGSLIWSSYLGGNGGENGLDVTVDSNDDIIFSGSTGSANFPVTSGAFQTAYGGPFNEASFYGDAFVAKFSNSGVMQWATYIGGIKDELGYGVAADAS